MNPGSPLDIKVVYSAKGVRRRAPRPVPVATRKAPAPATAAARSATAASPARSIAPARPLRTSAARTLGVLNLIAAAALCVAAWWWVDREIIYPKFIFNTPLDTTQLATMFGIPPAELNAPPMPAEPEAATPRFTGRTAQIMIGASGYGWLTLTSAAACALALAGGAAWGTTLKTAKRRIVWILLFGAFLGLAWGAYDTLSQYGRRYPPEHVRWSMVALTCLFALLGAAIARNVRGLTRLAGILVVVSALGSVAALWLGTQSGALPDKQAGLVFLLAVFAAHSIYGWFLLTLARRAL